MIAKMAMMKDAQNSAKLMRGLKNPVSKLSFMYSFISLILYASRHYPGDFAGLCVFFSFCHADIFWQRVPSDVWQSAKRPQKVKL